MMLMRRKKKRRGMECRSEEVKYRLASWLKNADGRSS
jgi:hypothetical protein